MASSWAVDIAKAFQTKPSEIDFSFGEVISKDPLTIKTRDTIVKKNLYINPAYLVSDEAAITKMFDDELRIPVHPVVFSFLKEFHCKYVLKPGDIVAVAQMGKSFYILEKMTKT